MWMLVAFTILLFKRQVFAALAAAMVVLYLRYSGHADVFYPCIDWVRVRGMDLWPGMLQMAGLVLVYAAGLAALTGRKRSAKSVVLLGALLSVGWWGFPSHFNLDIIGASGGSTVPVVVAGQIEQRQWDRTVLPMAAASAWPQVVRSEVTLSRIAHGMSQAGSPPRGVLRATLWAVQVQAMIAHMWLTAAVSGACVLLLLSAYVGGPLAGLGFWAWRLVGLSLWFPPVFNGVLRLVGLVGGLPEAALGLGFALLNAVVIMLVLYLARCAGDAWAD
jgi:hypothetical protein